MTYTIEREDAAEDLRVLRAAITVASGFVDGDADAMKRLRALADQIEEQVKPVVEEPRSFGSVVRVVYPPSAELRFCRTYSVDVDKPWCSGNHLRSWADVVEGATEVEVLRVGIGEPAVDQDSFSRGVIEGQRYACIQMKVKLKRLHADAITAERKGGLQRALELVERLLP